MRIAITGGIGSGKSYVCQLLGQRGISVYNCDAAAKRLMAGSPDIKRQLTELIGPEAYDGERLNKAAMARFLLSNEQNAKAIDAIVHPAVFSDFIESGMQWVESAILYESGLIKLVDKAIVVTAPQEIRISRVMQRDGISKEKALEWMARQWPQEKVKALADYEIVNDGIADLNQQIDNIIYSIESSCNKQSYLSPENPDSTN